MSSTTERVWDNEKVLEFLELYQAERVLWNPIVREHKNRNAIADAWQRLQASFSMNCSVAELKKKRESLMSTYRLYNKKIKDSIRSGVSTEDVYKTSWFAYELMDSFLGPVYNKSNSSTINTEAVTFSDQNEETNVSTEEITSAEKQSNIISDTTNTESTSTASTSTRKRRAVATADVAHARKQMDEAVGVLKTISEKSNGETSEVDLFCKLLAAKIKSFPQETREGIMHEIDELVYNKRLQKRRENMTTTPLSRTSSSFASPMTIAVPLSSPSPTSQSQFSVESYVQTQPDYSFNMYNTDYSQTDDSVTVNNVENISNDVIRKAFAMAHNTCTQLDH